MRLIAIARPIRWDAVAPSLPDEVGSLVLRDYCEGGVLHYVDHFTEFIIPEGEQWLGKTQAVMIHPNNWEQVARGLINKGLCEVWRESELHHVHGRPLLNGLFAVGKQEFICRLIMNLKPCNSLCRPLTGETNTLPSATALGSLFLDQDETLVTSSENIKCFFYLFQVPRHWMFFLGFGKLLPQSILDEAIGGDKGYLVTRVLPMGFLNSVAIAQHIHRNVVRRCMGSLRPSIGAESEIRRDRVTSLHPTLYRGYLDNFDRRTAALISGEVSAEVQVLRGAYQEAGPWGLRSKELGWMAIKGWSMPKPPRLSAVAPR